MDPVRDAFLAAWNRGDGAAIDAMFAPTVESRRMGILGRLVEKHGWGNDIPKAEFERQQRAPRRKGASYLIFSLGFSGMRTRWDLHEGGWRLQIVQF